MDDEEAVFVFLTYIFPFFVLTVLRQNQINGRNDRENILARYRHRDLAFHEHLRQQQAAFMFFLVERPNVPQHVLDLTHLCYACAIVQSYSMKTRDCVLFSHCFQPVLGRRKPIKMP